LPLVIEDAAANLHTDVILTSASFDGISGYKDKINLTDYEVYLYDSSGRAMPAGGSDKVLRLTIPAMRTTVIRCADLIGKRDRFWGGMRIRLWARSKQPTHVGDLFSAAYARWNWAEAFDTLHAHPDPLQFQAPERFYSSMPFPNLEEYACTLSLFNPYPTISRGRVIVHAGDAQSRVERAYQLPPYGTTLLNLNSCALTGNLNELCSRAVAPREEIKSGGSVLIENENSSVKNFAYMIIKGKADNAFAAEHTIHQGNYPVSRGGSPFGANQSFQAKGWLWSTFIFNRKTIGGLTMSSRVYLSSGRPLEDEMWLLGYVTDWEGKPQWSTGADEQLGFWLQKGFLNQGAIKLKPFQSCELDFEKLSLTRDFAGGIGLATSPQTSHVLMKVEVRIHNWGTAAFSHFRPGAKGARALQGIRGRDGLASDYVVSGVRVQRGAGGLETDCLIGVLNIERDTVGEPTIEVFDSSGFVTQKRLSDLPGWACRHFLLSEVLPELEKRSGPLTLRLIDQKAVVIMSALHIDYKRRDVAIDHGSDRFSTHLDYGCV
jgi:hypothetical protein